MKSEEHLIQQTAREKAEERAAAGLLALEMMHEIRNPLDALNNLLYLGLEAVHEPAPAGRYIRLAQEQADTIGEITSTILGFARPSPSKRSTCLVALVEAALRVHRKAMDEKRVQLVKDMPDGLIVEIHGGQILQVVSNLVANALEALPVDGTLYIRLRGRQDEAHLVVADNGPGIPKNIFTEIFKPFFTTKEEIGTGLGLALSKRIVEGHGGRIRVRSSVRPGKTGSIFKIALPAKIGRANYTVATSAV
jgi:signal transduction histidine kinase